MTWPMSTPIGTSTGVSAFAGGLTSPAERRRLYALIALMLYLVAIVARVVDMHQSHERFDFQAQDGRGYYLYLPGIIIEHSLSFEKLMTAHWSRRESSSLPALLADRTPIGYVNDRYPVGMAVTLSPAFLLAHGITLVLYHLTGSANFTPDGYTVVYQLLVTAWVLALGWGMLTLTDRLITKHFNVHPAAIAAGILLYWLGSNYIWYYVREMFMVHVVSGFWIMVCVTLLMRIIEKSDDRERYGRDMSILGFALGMAVVCRPTNVFIAPFFVWAIIHIYRTGGLKQFLQTVPAGLTFCVPLGIQMIVWKHLSGSPFYYSYQSEGFHFLHPALWQTLFHIRRHGIFIWTPLFILSVIGIVWWVRRANRQIEPILGCFILSGLLLWYLNSSWWCWWFADSLGGRAWIELAPLFILGLVFALNALRTASKSVRTAAYAFIAFCVMFNGVLALLYQLRIVPRS